MGLLSKIGGGSKRPLGARTIDVWKAGAGKNSLEFKDDKVQMFYLERPDDNARTWDFILTRGSTQFIVDEAGPCYRIHRNQAEANMQFYRGQELIFTMEWRGNGDIGGLKAAPKEHYFHCKGIQYEWSETGKFTGIDFFCKNAATKETIAYFKTVMTPVDKVGKLELHQDVDEKLEEMIVATFVAFREWSIRRQMCLYGENWFNQSVTV